MNGPVIGHLVLKDWRINRLQVSVALGVGIVALVLTQSGGETPRLLGAVWFFVVMCVLSSMLPASVILKERKSQTLALIMSLPVSSVQYGIAKVVSNWAMFLVPWLTLIVSALIVIETRHVAPRGFIPMLLILAMLPVIGFCLISATALVAESEGWLIAATILCNSSYWFVWYCLARIPSLTANCTGPAAVWNPAARTVLTVEVGIIVLILAVTMLLQSRKRDFI